MPTISAPAPIDPAAFAPDATSPATRYGLPETVGFCAACTYSNQKPNSEKEYKHNSATKKPTLAFDEHGVCRACRVAEEKEQVDWTARRAELQELCDRYRRTDGRYDVVVPGSGGKDSFYASWVLKNEFGMNPLTVTWTPHIYTEWGWQNFQSWMGAGFDNYLFTPNGRVHRLMTRLAIENLFHPFQPFMLGQMYFPPKLAAKLDIPLVFYGENPTEYGNSSRNDTASKDLSYITTDVDRADIHLAGMSVRRLQEEAGLSNADLAPYLPPAAEELAATKTDVRYLGYYLKWHPQNCYYSAVENGNFRASPERSAGTYSKYSSIDDKIDDFHYYTTFIKFGIGRATYDSAQEIRNGDITREEGVALVHRYDGEYPTRFEGEVFDYLSLPKREFPVASAMFEHPMMDRAHFDRLTDSFRSPHLWAKTADGWALRHQVQNAAG